MNHLCNDLLGHVWEFHQVLLVHALGQRKAGSGLLIVHQMGQMKELLMAQQQMEQTKVGR
jgi:hypothetical protein